MSSDSENFDQLRKLLALKRHEQPPPGYFNNFSGEVLRSIRADRQGTRELNDILEPVPWLLRLFSHFETKPFFAGAFGVGVCALLIAGIVYSEQFKPTPISNIAGPVVGTATLANATEAGDPLLGRMQPTTTTNESLREAENLFQQIQVKSTPVNFSMPGGVGH